MSKHTRRPKLDGITRRQLLTALGLTGASLYLPSLFHTRGKVKSQEAEPIRRTVIFTTHQGTVPPNWRMPRNNGDYGNWEYNFDDPNQDSFSTILRPLHPFREKLTVIEGMSYISAMTDRVTNAHNLGALHVLTGARTINDEAAGGPSVDQIIANHVAVPGRIRSLELAASSTGLYIGGFVNTAASQRAPVISNPESVFARLFPTGSAPEMEGGQDEPPSERSLIRSAKSSVLDLVGEEYAAIAPRLGSEDRARLQQHRELVRDLELRANAIASLDCGAPPHPDGFGDEHRLEKARAMADLVAAAFACDLTRVATIQMPDLWPVDYGASGGDTHQDYAHQWDSNDNALLQMTNYNRVACEQFTHLVNALDQYSDNGGTLLDNTAAVWMSDMAHGNHSFYKVPIVVAGGLGGAIRTGRYISHAQDVVNPVPGIDLNVEPRHAGQPHNKFLISLMQGMGLPNNEIGVTSAPTDGPGSGSVTVDFTGPLPRLA